MSDKMSWFTSIPIIPGSITVHSAAQCLICLKSYTSATGGGTPEILETLSKQFEVFCKFMKIEPPSNCQPNFSAEPFPFCEECQLTLSRLQELNELLEETQKRIAVVISTLSANIILSGNSTSNGELKICPYDAHLPGTGQCSAEEKVKYCRGLIYKRYSPQLEISLLRQLSRTGNSTNLIEGSHEMLKIPEQHTTEFLWNSGSEIIGFEEAATEEKKFRFVKQESQGFEVVLHYEEASPENFEFGLVKQESDSLEVVNYEEAKEENNAFPIIKEESEARTDVEEYVRGLAEMELVQNETSATGFPIVIQPTEVKTEFGEVGERLWADKAAEEVTALNIRLTSLSSPAKRLSCEICGAQYFSSKSELITHLQTKHPVLKRESTDFCKTLSGKYMLNGKSLFQISDVDNEYKCSSCSFASEKLTEMKHHVRYKHIEIFICTDCGKKFSSKYNLQRHRTFHENGTLFCCDVCGKQLNLKQRLQDSKAYVHPKTADKEFPCE
ncbi:unnamed protein product, partial [Allacma fusca]